MSSYRCPKSSVESTWERSNVLASLFSMVYESYPAILSSIYSLPTKSVWIRWNGDSSSYSYIGCICLYSLAAINLLVYSARAGSMAYWDSGSINLTPTLILEFVWSKWKGVSSSTSSFWGCIILYSFAAIKLFVFSARVGSIANWDSGSMNLTPIFELEFVWSKWMLTGVSAVIS